MSDAYVFNLVGSNSHAVKFWLQRNGLKVEYYSTDSSVSSNKILVVPGVLSFDAANSQLKKMGGDGLIRTHVDSGGRVIGVCCGMQILFESSEEGQSSGLGILKGKCKRIAPGEDAVPNVGWKSVVATGAWSKNITGLFNSYFMHSFALMDVDEKMLGESGTVLKGSCNGEFIAGVVNTQFFLTQFHPEKSYGSGDTLLKSFIEYE